MEGVETTLHRGTIHSYSQSSTTNDKQQTHRRQKPTTPFRAKNQIGRPYQHALVQLILAVHRETSDRQSGTEETTELDSPSTTTTRTGSHVRRRHLYHQQFSQTHDHRARRPHHSQNGTRLSTNSQENKNIISNTRSKKRKTARVVVQGMNNEILPPEGNTKCHGQLVTFDTVEFAHRIKCAWGQHTHEPLTGVDVTKIPTEGRTTRPTQLARGRHE